MLSQQQAFRKKGGQPIPREFVCADSKLHLPATNVHGPRSKLRPPVDFENRGKRLYEVYELRLAVCSRIESGVETIQRLAEIGEVNNPVALV